ncbi:MAG: hypothetical protein HQ530_02090 [Parcubacteria group bacterium]|nr:hypothetical protein [Parcubacteria group bacterium]
MQKEWRNLAPEIIRQRLIIEGTTEKIVKPPQIGKYLLELSEVTGMEAISDPITGDAHKLGYAGWIHWRTSGTHFYSYHGNPPLFTVDTYTCKPFSIEKTVKFTEKYFNAIDIVWQEVKV